MKKLLFFLSFFLLFKILSFGQNTSVLKTTGGGNLEDIKSWGIPFLNGNYLNTTVNNDPISQIASPINYGKTDWTGNFSYNENSNINENCNIIYPAQLDDGLGTINTLKIAADFLVESNTRMEVTTIKAHIFGNVSTLIVSFYENDQINYFQNQPGAQISAPVSIVPTSQTYVSTANGYNIYEVTVTLPTPQIFEGNASGTKYWLGLSSTKGTENADNYWGFSTSINNSTHYFYSSNNGSTWFDSQIEGVRRDGAFTLDGTCTEVVPTGCLTAPNGQFPTTSFTPLCDFSIESITNGSAGKYGEYSIINVNEGVEYAFSTDVPTAFITISNSGGTMVIGSGTGSVNWIATFTGSVRFYTHGNNNCSVPTSLIERRMKCKEPIIISDPDFSCFQGDGLASTSEDAQNITSWYVADDFIVDAGEIFTLKQIRMNVWATSPVTNVQFRILNDTNGFPNSVIESVTMTPSSSRIVDMMLDFSIYELTFDLPTPIQFTEGRYWLNPIASSGSGAVFWDRVYTPGNGSYAMESPNGTGWNIFGSTPQQIFFVSGECFTFEGCLDAPFGQFPTESYTPECRGLNESIAIGQFGEYSIVNVVPGTVYTFYTDVSSAFISISDSMGTTVLASGTGSVTWTATRESIRFYTHENNQCPSSENSIERLVTCGDLLPSFACEDFKVLSNNFDNMVSFGGHISQRLAFDMQVTDTGFTLYGIEPTVVGPASSFSFIFYKNEGGLPGEQIATRAGMIINSVVTGNNNGYEFTKYTIRFSAPIELAANTTYWVEMQSNAEYWETTSLPQSRLGYYDVAKQNDEDWYTMSVGYQLVFDLLCGTLDLNDVTNFDFSYYPNPVNDILNISTKESIESISIFDLSGQKVINDIAIIDSQINVKSLTTGTYILQVLFGGGQIETFKIIKK